jgi:glutathione S-transferase
MSSSTNSTDPITIYVMPGSQYSAKVLAALDAFDVPHFVHFVSTDRTKRNLPSGGTMVPEMTVGTSKDEVLIVKDSEHILHWLDEHRGTRLFPTDQASELSVRASDGVLAGAVLYYNWVNDEGYARSMQTTLAEKAVPAYVLFFRQQLVDYFVSDERQKFRTKAADHLGLEESQLDDEPRVHKMLIEELLFFQSLLKDGKQSYLLPGDKPTAADFSMYAQLERLVGTEGDANVRPSLPMLKAETRELARLWQWHDLMLHRHPIRFKGKRAPAKM